VGLILDSGVLIVAERGGQSVTQVVDSLAIRVGDEALAISVVTLMERAHGASRANTSARKAMRLHFLDELAIAVPVYPITTSIALRAGSLDGESTSRRVRVALADLLIGVTALELGYRLATANVRHFEQIPGLEVLSF
jgi:predicted nucleic acid-binding protein